MYEYLEFTATLDAETINNTGMLATHYSRGT